MTKEEWSRNTKRFLSPVDLRRLHTQTRVETTTAASRDSSTITAVFTAGRRKQPLGSVHAGRVAAFHPRQRKRSYLMRRWTSPGPSCTPCWPWECSSSPPPRLLHTWSEGRGAGESKRPGIPSEKGFTAAWRGLTWNTSCTPRTLGPGCKIVPICNDILHSECGYTL